MITDDDFYGMFRLRHVELMSVDDAYVYCDFDFGDGRLGLGNLTIDRARFLGFLRLDNGVWLFPSWYGSMLVDGAVYVHEDGDDWVYASGDCDLCLRGDGGRHLTFGVRFGSDGLVLA